MDSGMKTTIDRLNEKYTLIRIYVMRHYTIDGLNLVERETPLTDEELITELEGRK
jgi:hypothetical protein